MSLCVQGCVCRAACARRLRVWLDVHLRTHGCDCVWPREWMLTGHLCAWRREGWGQTDRQGGSGPGGCPAYTQALGAPCL